MLSVIFTSCLFFLALQPVTSQYLPDAKSLTIREFEHLYLDGAANSIASAVTPCSNYIDPSTGASNNGLGRQTASEWVRVAFRKLLHFITSDHIAFTHKSCISFVA